LGENFPQKEVLVQNSIFSITNADYAMRAQRSAKKGEIISRHIPVIVVPTERNIRPKQFATGIDFCNTCAKALFPENDENNNERKQIRFNKLTSFQRNTHKRNDPILDYSWKNETFGVQSYIRYCSSTCFQVGQLLSLDHYIMSTSKDFDSKLFSVSRHTELQRIWNISFCSRRLNYSEGALVVVVSLYLFAFGIEDSIENLENNLERKSLLIQFLNSCKNEKRSINEKRLTTQIENHELQERLFECWVLLQNVCSVSNAETNASCNKKESGQIEQIKTELKSSSLFFHFMHREIYEKYLFPITILDPLLYYIKNKLLHLSYKEISTIVNGPLDTLCQSIASTDQDMDTMDDRARTKIITWRKTVRLLQAVTSTNEVQEDKEFNSLCGSNFIKNILKMRHHYMAFCPELGNLKHSCAPNCFVESNMGEDGMGPCEIVLISLHDLDVGEELTISRIDDLSQDVEMRSSALKLIFGLDFECKCFRCLYDRISQLKDRAQVLPEIKNFINNRDQNGKILFSTNEIKQLGDLGMQQGRYKDALELYDLILKVDPNDGDILHARCASFLERGYFSEAQKMWKDAYKKCPGHDGISLTIEKQSAYNDHKMEKEGAKKDNDFKLRSIIDDHPFNTLLDGKCFITDKNHPLLSPIECETIIKLTEQAARKRGEVDGNDGWTTSRHYAVPTTDIPIHEIPSILKIFRQLFYSKIHPILVKQFSFREVHVHDAFVVRYNATNEESDRSSPKKGQNHLPLHRDQSTHSFVLALNDTVEYKGGGTYIAKLRKSIRPSIGSMLSFRGDTLLHGGDPVVEGTRFIIVAFCYLEEYCNDTNTAEENPTSKRIKLDAMFKKTDDEDNSKGSFSFGFNI